MSLHPGDKVILNDGREVFVIQAAEFDTVFQFAHNAQRRFRRGWKEYTEWADQSQIAWNYDEAFWATLDSELMQDYT
jgi:hypothetical protein